MKYRIRNLSPALVVFAFGSMVMIEAIQHDLGTMLRIGPGFFPLCLGVALLLASIGILFDPHDNKDSEVASFSWRQLVAIAMSIAAFAILIEHMGLIPAAAILICIAAMANPASTLKGTLLLAATLPLALGIVFIYGLRMPIKLIGWF